MYQVVGSVGVLIILILIALYTYNNFQPTHDRYYDSIIFISGSYTKPGWLRPWRQYLERQFPDSQVVIIDGYYAYGDGQATVARLETMVDKVSEALTALSSDDKVAVIAYSYGGVLLDVAYHQLVSDKQAPVLARVVTMASPLADDSLFTDQKFLRSRELLGFSGASLPNHTPVCGRFDSLVDCTRARYKPADTVVKTWANHYMYVVPQLFSGRAIMNILDKKPQ